MALASLILLTALAAPQQTVWFPFVIPWDDSVKGTATDVGALNDKPAGKNGWIVARNGVLVESKTGRRRRFIGTNFTTRAAFPSHRDADKVAARLAKLGINIVRFHHLQNSWDKEKGMIWKQGREMIEVDPKQLDRLDYLISALKKQGIYSNINLQTTRDYLPEMGFPESVKKLPWGFAKRVDKWDRKMIALQKAYAKELIGRKNKHTGLRYTDDPAIMVVEINNENSLVGAPWETLGGGLDTVPEPFKGDLRKLWNEWLAEKYPSNQTLARAWSATRTPRGPNMLSGANQWTFEQIAPSAMVATGRVSREGASYRAEVTKTGGPEWSLQTNIAGLTLNNRDTYTVAFRGKADRKRTVLVHAGLDNGDYHNVGLTYRADLDTNWRDFKLSFKVERAEPAHVRVGLWLASAVGVVEIDGLTLSPGAEPFVLPSGQSLAQKTIELPNGSGTEVQQMDFMDFLTATEAAYALEMRTYLRNELGFKGLMNDTQISWGGLTGLVREAPMEIVDNHSYYHHPSFPGGDWNPVNWTVTNSPMVYDLGPGFSELGGLAQYRVYGKPYSISEYNHPAPMDFRAEMMPLISSFAAVQDWDIIYSFDYGSYGAGEPNNKVQGFFAVGSDPSKAAFFPAAAMLFRHGLIPRASGETVLVLMPKPYEVSKTAYAAWADLGGIPDLFQNRIAIRVAGPDVPVKMPTPPKGKETVRLLDAGTGKVYVADAPAAKVAVGNLGGKVTNLGVAQFAVRHFGNDFATVTLTACDSQPLQKSKRSLLTVVGRIENRNMGWNKDRTSVGDKWGEGPTQAEFVPLTLILAVDGPRQVWALDGNGRRKKKVGSEIKGGKLIFSTLSTSQTLWYEIAKK